MVLFDAKRREPVAESASPAAAAQGGVVGARASACGWPRFTSSHSCLLRMLTAEFVYAKSQSALSPATEVSFTNGQVKIPLAQVSDGDLHRFQAQENGTEIRFWLYQKPDGKIATVFDACEICGAVGFYKSGNGVVCKNCAAPINPQSVGTAGGCNPIPLKATQTADCRDYSGGGHRGR